MRVRLTEGEIAVLKRWFPSQPWRTEQEFTSKGLSRLEQKRDELNRKNDVNTGTSRFQPGMAYDAELLDRIIVRCDNDQPSEWGGEARKGEG